jgi:putative tryptophan/tyrosine transport system substrate-binding protein
VKRREFIAGLSSTAVCPVVARAQQPALPVIGLLHPESLGTSADQVAAFRKGLSETGRVEGRNVAIEYRFADGKNNQMPALAADLVRRPVTVIAAGSDAAALAAKAATATIPVVFRVGVDPVLFGLVASLNRPGGNLTGVTSLGIELVPKRLELFREMVPNATVMAALSNPTNPGAEAVMRGMRQAARALGLQIHDLHASTERDFDMVFATLDELRAGGLLINGDAVFVSRRAELMGLALRHAMPTISQFREFPAAGGLMSYGANIRETYRLAGVYVGRILNGAEPADLPVQQATTIDLVINVKTAKALGLTIPETLLATADEVIQ